MHTPTSVPLQVGQHHGNHSLNVFNSLCLGVQLTLFVPQALAMADRSSSHIFSLDWSYSLLCQVSSNWHLQLNLCEDPFYVFQSSVCFCPIGYSICSSSVYVLLWTINNGKSTSFVCRLLGYICVLCAALSFLHSRSISSEDTEYVNRGAGVWLHLPSGGVWGEGHADGNSLPPGVFLDVDTFYHLDTNPSHKHAS